jgi:hypothetical protein
MHATSCELRSVLPPPANSPLSLVLSLVSPLQTSDDAFVPPHNFPPPLVLHLSPPTCPPDTTLAELVERHQPLPDPHISESNYANTVAAPHDEHHAKSPMTPRPAEPQKHEYQHWRRHYHCIHKHCLAPHRSCGLPHHCHHHLEQRKLRLCHRFKPLPAPLGTGTPAREHQILLTYLVDYR